MTRVKGGVTALKHRKNVLKQTKGFRFGRSTKERQAREALFHAGNHAFAHRRNKKNDFRRMWQVQIGSEVKQYDLSYSRFIDALHKKNIGLDRKVLAGLAEHHPGTFKKVVEMVK
jgi:large subunit ribosomal protein L20